MATVAVCFGQPGTSEHPVLWSIQRELMECLYDCSDVHRRCLDDCEQLLRAKANVTTECDCMTRLPKCSKKCHQMYPQ